ncbi:MAG: flagellar biosynthesis protein FlhA, partial [Pirellulaceae bacterium]
HNDRGLFVRMSPQAIENSCKIISDSIAKLTRENHRPILLVSPQIRPAVKQISSANLPNLIVLSYNEITRDTRIESLGMVSDAVPA